MDVEMFSAKIRNEQQLIKQNFISKGAEFVYEHWKEINFCERISLLFTVGLLYNRYDFSSIDDWMQILNNKQYPISFLYRVFTEYKEPYMKVVPDGETFEGIVIALREFAEKYNLTSVAEQFEDVSFVI